VSARKYTENFRGKVPTAVTNPREDSAVQANHLPGKVPTVVTLPSKDSARWMIVQKNAAQNFHGEVPTAVSNPCEGSAGQTNRLPGKVPTVVTLPSKDSARWTIVQKNAAQNLHGKAPTAMTNPGEDFADQDDPLPGKVSMVVTLPSKDPARWTIVQKIAAQNLHGKVPTAVTNPSERSAGQTNCLPGNVSTSVTLRSKDYTGWAIVLKNAVENLHPKVPTAVYSPGEDSEGRVVAGK
jgi:hypothetical protein